MKITKQFDFCMAHRLTFHKGKCYNLHGHNYLLEVEVEGKLDENGFVMDFGDLKEIVKPFVEWLDHSLWVYNRDEILIEAHKIYGMETFKTNIMDMESTAENIAKWFWQQLKLHTPDQLDMLRRIRVWETSTSYAEYDGT
jgi:6-pyruvoyltetrahydropterin/6-carboxytetrahydropterin synthase